MFILFWKLLTDFKETKSNIKNDPEVSELRYFLTKLVSLNQLRVLTFYFLVKFYQILHSFLKTSHRDDYVSYSVFHILKENVM